MVELISVYFLKCKPSLFAREFLALMSVDEMQLPFPVSGFPWSHSVPLLSRMPQSTLLSASWWGFRGGLVSREWRTNPPPSHRVPVPLKHLPGKSPLISETKSSAGDRGEGVGCQGLLAAVSLLRPPGHSSQAASAGDAAWGATVPEPRRV